MADPEVNGSGNETGNESGGEDGGLGNWVSNATPSVGSPVPSGSDVVKDIVEWAIEDVKGGLEDVIDRLHFLLIGLPSPGEADDIGSWVPPENGAWPHVFAIFGVSSSISIIMLVFATQFVFGMNDLKRKREATRQIARAFFVGPVLGFPIIAIVLHAGNAFAMALSPSGQEFLMETGSIADLGFGFLLGAVLIKFKLLVVIIGLAVLIIIYFSILFLAAAWPALWAMRVVPIPTLQSWGTLGITGFGKLVILRVTQAFLLRFTFEMPWGSVGTGGFFLEVLGTAVGILIALVGLPWIVLRKITIASAVGLGMSGVTFNSANAKERLRSGASTVRSKLKDARSTKTPRNTGSIQSHAYSGESKTSASASARSVGSFGSSDKSRSKSSKMQSLKNANRAAKTRSDD